MCFDGISTGSPKPANPSLQPTRYGWLRQPPRAAELKRWAAPTSEATWQRQLALA